MYENSGRPLIDPREALNRHTKAAYKARALVEIERLIQGGKGVTDSVREVAYQTGIAERSLFTYLRNTKSVPREDWTATLSRKMPPDRRKTECHPEVLRRFIELCRSGEGIAESYRFVVAEAEKKGLEPIPSERTLRRRLADKVSWSELWMAKRAAKPAGEF